MTTALKSNANVSQALYKGLKQLTKSQIETAIARLDAGAPLILNGDWYRRREDGVDCFCPMALGLTEEQVRKTRTLGYSVSGLLGISETNPTTTCNGLSLGFVPGLEALQKLSPPDARAFVKNVFQAILRDKTYRRAW